MQTRMRALWCGWGVWLSLLPWDGRPSVLFAHELAPGVIRTSEAGPLVTPESLPPAAPDSGPLGSLPQTLSTLFGASLATAIRQGRDQAYPQGQPIPEEIRHTLAPFFPGAVLQRVRYSLAWEAAAQGGLLHVLVGTGTVAAVTLGDVIVFRDEQGVGDPLLWAHELVHVEQYRRLGIEGLVLSFVFALRTPIHCFGPQDSSSIRPT
jgi:hypothetical protein